MNQALLPMLPLESAALRSNAETVINHLRFHGYQVDAPLSTRLTTFECRDVQFMHKHLQACLKMPR